MASTATARLRFEKQGTGDNNNTWGAKLNTTGLDLIDAAIAGVTSYSLSGSKTLTANNYAADEARMPVQFITGGTGGTVTVPSQQGKWFFYNGSSGDVIVTLGSGTTVTLATGDATWVFTDGTNCYKGLTKAYVDAAIAAAALGGISNLPASQGGTGITSYTIGDILYASASTTLSKLAGVATGNALISGGVGTAPSWGKIGLTTHVSGTLPVANGGTGVTSSTGSGKVVLDTSPTLVTPNLGTPSAGILSNCTAATQSAGDNSTKIATTAYADAARSWTQIGSTLTTTSGATASFTGIAQTYSELLVEIDSISHDSGSTQTLQIEVSPDGSTWSTALAISSSIGAANALRGGVHIPGYTKAAGMAACQVAAITGASGTAAGGVAGFAWKIAGIAAIRFSWSSGSFDAGTIKLWGK